MFFGCFDKKNDKNLHSTHGGKDVISHEDAYQNRHGVDAVGSAALIICPAYAREKMEMETDGAFAISSEKERTVEPVVMTSSTMRTWCPWIFCGLTRRKMFLTFSLRCSWSR